MSKLFPHSFTPGHRQEGIAPFEPVGDAIARIVARVQRRMAEKHRPSPRQVYKAKRRFYGLVARHNEQRTDWTEAAMSDAYVRWADLRARASLEE